MEARSRGAQGRVPVHSIALAFCSLVLGRRGWEASCSNAFGSDFVIRWDVFNKSPQDRELMHKNTQVN